MNKLFLFITILYVSLCCRGVYAQNAGERGITVEEMFSLADRNSKTLQPFVTMMEEAVQSVKMAKNSRLPDINASISLSFLGDGVLLDRDFSNSMNAPIPHFGNNFALEVSQIIYAGGVVNSRIEINRLQEKMAALSLEGVFIFGWVCSYLDLFKQKNLARVYEQNIVLTRQILADIKARYTEGVSLENDITRYELQLSNLELQQTRIGNAVAILNRNLVTMLGLPEDTRLRPDTSLVSRSMPLEGMLHWRDQALRYALSLRQTSLVVEMNRQQEQVTKSELLPQIAFFANNHFDGPITIEVPPMDKNFNYWYAGVGVKYNLSSLYKSNKSVKRSKLETRRAMQQYEDIKEQTDLAVRAEAHEQLHVQMKNVELARQNYAVVYNRYKNGVALIADMLDASVAKLSAEQQLVNACVNIIFHYYKLLYISGTL